MSSVRLSHTSSSTGPSVEADAAGAAELADAPGASYWHLPLHMAGAEIVELRRAVGWSQADLAAHIAYSQRQVSRWERGQQLVSPDARVAILRAVMEARMTVEEERLMRYQLQRWLRNFQQSAASALARVGLR